MSGLILTRQQGESIVIFAGDDEIKFTIKHISKKTVALNFNAPSNIKVLREEIIK